MTMAWYAFERDKAFVMEALQRGDFDYMEVVGAVEETRFFQTLLGEGVLSALAADYPTPRRKEEVPLWLYLASELTLRLHGAMGFGAYPYVLHCGGLLDALGPQQVQHKLDGASGESHTMVQGYNQKNHYTRITPCDKDFLRKLGKDTGPEALEHWFGTSVPRQYQALGAFDPEGLFLIDGTYIFVPLDNDRYERSSRLLFGENGHPIDQPTFDALPRERQQRCQWRRCYRAVTLSHTTRDRDYSLRCGVKVLEGKAAEAPCVWPIVKRTVDAVGRGVIKLLVYDRGLIDGKTVSDLKAIGVDSLFPLKKGMDLWEDAKVLAQQDPTPWRRYDLPQPPAPTPPPDRPEIITRREAKRQETLQRKRQQAQPLQAPRTLQSVQYRWIEPSRVWETCDVPVAVLLLINHYTNGDRLEWALASTRVFQDPLDMWTTYRLRPGVEEDHRQEKCFWDMTHFRSTAFSLVVNQIVFVELAYSLIQIFLRKVDRNELVGATRQRLLDALLPQQNKIALYYQQRFGHFCNYEYQEMLLDLTDGARRKALGRTRQLRRAQLTPPELPWRRD
jgi:hypothetical protein